MKQTEAGTGLFFILFRFLRFALRAEPSLSFHKAPENNYTYHQHICQHLHPCKALHRALQGIFTGVPKITLTI